MIKIVDFNMLYIDKIMQIWLDTNINTHIFIPKTYWENNFDTVKKLIPQSNVYVALHYNNIIGFIGVYNGFIAGIFILSTYQSKGYGKALLDHIKAIYTHLYLEVYEKNKRAIDFYKREGFIITERFIDTSVNEYSYKMEWSSCQNNNMEELKWKTKKSIQ